MDARITRASLQLRRLSTDIAELCSELARLIVPEEREGHHHWVYRGSGECPGRHNRFPVGKPTAGRLLAKQRCEVDDVARSYITAVQPCRQTDNHCRADLRQDSRGLALPGDIRNRDKHRLLLTASVLWPGTHGPDQLRFSRYRSRRTLSPRPHGRREPGGDRP